MVSKAIPVNVGATELELLELLLETLLEVLLDELLEDVVLEMMLEVVELLAIISEVLLVNVELELLLGVELTGLSWHPTAIPMTTAPRSNVLMSFFMFLSFL